MGGGGCGLGGWGNFCSDVTQLFIPKRLSLLFAMKVAVGTNWLKVTHFTAYKVSILCDLMGHCWYQAPNTFPFSLLVQNVGFVLFYFVCCRHIPSAGATLCRVMIHTVLIRHT